MTNEPLDLMAIRARLANRRGRQYWRSLEEVAETEAFKEFLHREFPKGASEWAAGISRRTFIKLMGASLALAGLSGCTTQEPVEKIVPYIQAPENIVLGKPLYYATAVLLNGLARGVLVESHEGRPTKIEGNPDHPASLGSTDIFMQADILGLYDPDRSQVVRRAGRISTWADFMNELAVAMENQRTDQGAGLRLLTESITSLTLAAQIEALLAEFPQAVWHQYQPLHDDNIRAGAELAFGEALNPIYHFDQAEVILALDADFLGPGPAQVRYARDFAGRRHIEAGATLNRLYAIESAPGLTGAIADHRLRLKPSRVAAFAAALAGKLGVLADAPTFDEEARWLDAVAADLQANRGVGLVVVGPEQPAAVQALVHAINEALGNVGQTVTYTEPVAVNPINQTESLWALVEAMAGGQVEMLVMLGGNPLYNAPADLNFGAAFDKVPLRIHLSLYEDETSYLSHWHIPASHSLESWSDARAYDGTITIMQPLIAPLYDSRSAHELLAAMMGQIGVTGHDLVRSYWQSRQTEGDFETFWQTTLHDGFVAETALPAKPVSLQLAGLTGSIAPAESGGLEINFRADGSIWDGSYANSGWLQELPRPLTKIAWDNAVLLSPETALQANLVNGDMVELTYQGRSLSGPVWITPGHADGVVTVALGYGRTRAGRVGDGVGFNAYALRASTAPYADSGLELRPTGAKHKVVTTQDHHSMEGRHLVRAGTVAEFEAHPEFVHEFDHHSEENLSLYPGFEYNDNAWGMTINLSACIGCNACTIACQAENNIPVVGKDQVAIGREMHWIRVDRYFEGDLDDPQTYHQPIPCMQCENAPCEVVCPVAATVHSAEGLNDMVYNRCVGTRYCANNCPYKVRRFNFLQFSDETTPVIRLLHNPDVTVRHRGVMEKCTYCVQRINVARIEAKKEDRPIRDGEIVTACQGACPTQAIVFGNINDPDSQVAKIKAGPLNYGLLAELATKPRTTYLARISNPNPELETE